MKSARLRGVVFFVLGAAALFAAVRSTQLRFLVAGGLVCFLLGATALSRAGQLAPSLRPFRHRSVHVHVWGAPVPASGGGPARIDSVRAFSAGLLIYLRPTPDGPRTLLKVAQPGPARNGDGLFEIDEARYVSWGGKKRERVPGQPALKVVVAS